MKSILQYQKDGYIIMRDVLRDSNLSKQEKNRIYQCYEKRNQRAKGFNFNMPYSFNATLHFKDLDYPFQDYGEIIAQGFAGIMGLNAATYYQSIFEEVKGMISFEPNNFELMHNILKRYKKEGKGYHYPNTDLSHLNGLLPMYDVLLWLNSTNQYSPLSYQRVMGKVITMFVYDMLFLIEDRIDENWGICYKKQGLDVRIFDNSAIFNLWTGASDFEHINYQFFYNHFTSPGPTLDNLLATFFRLATPEQLAIFWRWLNYFKSLDIETFLMVIEKEKRIVIPKEVKEGFKNNFQRHFNKINDLLYIYMPYDKMKSLSGS